MQPAIDLAPFRCPALNPAERTAFAFPPAKPEAGALDQAKLKAWIDALELQIERVNADGRRLVAKYDRCRGRAQQTVTS